MDRIEAHQLAELLAGWSTASGPLYQRLAGALRKAVHADQLASGIRLPSERDLARAVALSRSTVVAAYDELRADGLVESRRGSGTTVAVLPQLRRPGADGVVPGGQGNAIMQRLVDSPSDVISLTTAEASAGPELAHALAEVARHDMAALTAEAGYHPRGMVALRTALAEDFTAQGVPTTADQVVVTTGATQAIALVAQTYLRKGSVVLVESPGWPGCLDVFRAAGATTLGVAMDEEGVRVDAFAAALPSKPSLVFLMPTHHNPTGTLMSASRRRRISELARAEGIPLVEDNSYNTDADSSTLPRPIAAYGGGEVVSIGSLAKTLWPGLRIGWLRAPEEVAERVARHKVIADMGTPLIDQAVALRLIPRLGEITAAHAAVLRARREHLGGLLKAHLPDWRWQPPAGGSALWIELPGVDARVFAQVALRYGVEVVPGASTDTAGIHDSFVRLPFTFPEATLTEVVARLTKAWAALGR
ncbi:PLP-dependent aminotransferase family protein [Nocardioides speluncae]|uniref:aminotransferase-like domain-containing protein n=1 Tax=Nocardioides speluncae TaxID=2670337 RepID=UPI00197E903F|nr:PLP-dependent aminotransferase family protein [Nocardioides speluncae]